MPNMSISAAVFAESYHFEKFEYSGCSGFAVGADGTSCRKESTALSEPGDSSRKNSKGNGQ
jgi:hypothetical protein